MRRSLRTPESSQRRDPVEPPTKVPAGSTKANPPINRQVLNAIQ